MFNFEKISISFSLDPVLYVLAFLVLAAYTIFVYRYTIPRISPAKKIILIILRTVTLILLLLFIFEPILTLYQKKIMEPVNLVFVDNSRSITIDDGTNRTGTVNSFINELPEYENSDNLVVYSFGNNINPVSIDSLSKINFTDGTTDFASVFNFVKQSEENIASISIISDGVITEGVNPVFTAEKMSIPIYTVGIGDTTSRNDVAVKNILYNEYIYAETPTAIVSTITNHGFGGKSTAVSLYENNTLVEQKNIELNGDGFQNVSFTYTPESGGEKKLRVAVASLQGEFSSANNSKIFYIDVLSNKIKVLLVAGSPSSDLSFIKSTLESDENLTVNSITQISAGKFVENNNRQSLVDSSDILFLIGFPSRETPSELLHLVKANIEEKNKPFFFLLTNSVDVSKLSALNSYLPFTISGASQRVLDVQPYITPEQSGNPLLQNNAADPITAWNNLPPVYQSNADLNTKAESEIIARVKVNNVPLENSLILTRSLGSKRSIAVLAGDIWKWKLQTATKDSDLFDRFILSSVKWLNTSEEQKQVNIKTSKKLYSIGEEVEFSAQVYDETFNPVSDAEVKINIKSGQDTYEINLSSLGNGLYEGTFQTNKAGDYTFSGSASAESRELGRDAGSFNIGEVAIEMTEPRMNYEFLNLLSNETGGKFYFNSDYDNLFDELSNLVQSSSKEKMEVNEIKLWSNEWLMAFVILLFSIEWFIRKRSGML